MTEVRLIPGGLHRDERGEVRYGNGFRLDRVDRFYSVYPVDKEEMRGWVGHRREWKWFFLQGAFDVGIIVPDDWHAPSRALPVTLYHISAANPQVMEIPPGCVPAHRSADDRSILAVFHPA